MVVNVITSRSRNSLFYGADIELYSSSRLWFRGMILIWFPLFKACPKYWSAFDNLMNTTDAAIKWPTRSY